MFFAQIRTRDVLDSAPWLVRFQLWCLGFLGFLIVSSVRVYARGGGMIDVPITSWWPFVLAVLSWAVSLGMWLSQLSELKARVKSLEEALPSKVSDALLAAKLDTIAAQISSLHQLLAQSDRQWRDSLHGSKE
jgi:hypothetical protein